MLQAKTFRITTGYCHVLLDSIIFTDTEAAIEQTELKASKKGNVWIAIYSSIAGILLICSTLAALIGNTYRALLFLMATAWFTIRAFRRSLYVPVPVIPRSAITNIEFKPYIYSVQNPHFIVHYKSSNGWKKRMHIVLGDGRYQPTAEEIQLAIDIMDEEFG